MKKRNNTELKKISFLIIILIVLIIISLALDSVIGAFNALVPVISGTEGGGTSGKDTTPPTIYNLKVSILDLDNEAFATISFSTNEPAKRRIYYSLNPLNLKNIEYVVVGDKNSSQYYNYVSICLKDKK